MHENLSSSEGSKFTRRDLLALEFVKEQREQSPASEKDKTWKEFEPILLNGSEIRLLGVLHDVKYLPQMKDKIDEVVNWSDIVLLEYLPFEIEEQPLSRFIYNVITIGGLDDHARPFYRKILTEYREEGKTIGCVDPDGLMFGGVWNSILAGTQTYTAIKILTEPLIRMAKRKAMTRRQFLTIAAMLLPAVYLKSRTSLVGSIIRSRSDNDDYTLGDTLFADTKNYRDVRSAENIVRLTRMFQGKGGRNIVYIAGMSHPNVVRSYATEDHDLEKTFKIPFNTLHSLFAENQTRLYSYRGGSWVKDQSIT